MPALTENPSPRLAELQDWLRWIFTEPKGISAALNAPATGLRRKEPQPRALSSIANGPPIGVKQRLAVYADAYFLRLLESMESDFKAVRRAVGSDSFRRLVADYLLSHPSASPNICDLGAAFPSFVMGHALNRELPFLADLATLERAFFMCLYTDRMPPLDPASIKNADTDVWSKARLVFDPTVRLLDLGWPVHKLWKNRDQSEKKGVCRLSKPARQRLLLFRDDDWVNVQPIDAAEFLMIDRLSQGAALDQACLELQQSNGDIGPERIQSWFATWTANGVVKRVEFQRPI